MIRLPAWGVTLGWQQQLMITANGADGRVDPAVPHTVGMGDTTEPVEIKLAKDRNVLRCSQRSSGEAKGFTIRDFTLTPIH